MVGDQTLVSLDLHVHSSLSYDGHEPVSLLLEHARDIGLDGLVVTDHDRIAASLEAADLASEYGLVGIPGVEVSTAEGHLLAIGVDERPARGMSYAETVTRVHELGGAAVVPHPFQRTRHGVRRRVLDETVVDAVEVYNSMLFTGFRNRRARRYATSYGYGSVAGSDAHYLGNVGRAYTEVAVDAPSVADVSVEQVVEALSNGDTSVVGRRTPIGKSAVQYGKGSLRKALYEFTSRAPLVPAVPRSIAEYRTDG
ncbi:PHP domain-containing protein [Halorubellus sp. JP-L1]|uniref:CehA/McbA family metallohydrolase n=1 Tax=Halorubellus sp. JP-L1 TaxID=2715753 RepID=UPI00140A2A2B|nr:PHP domain-containing protein [Halorubellus sp. JP-L1]NHN42084.1 PHP domain-containing protein [Halorubellus sp. JP-L1]